MTRRTSTFCPVDLVNIDSVKVTSARSGSEANAMEITVAASVLP
jgi:hypothetical protein